jgi:outer membrane protein
MKMKASRWVLLVMSLSLMSGTPVWAASSSKIGYFELMAVLQQSVYGKQMTEDLKREGEKLKADVDEKAHAFKSSKEEYDKKKSVMDESARKKKERELQELQESAEKLLMESRAKLNKRQADYLTPLQDRIMEIVRKIGRDDKYDYILEREKSGLFFANEKEDLSKRIIQELDKAPPVPKK